MQIVIGAAVFAVGVFCGAVIYAAGQQSQKSRSGKAFQDALLKNLEKTSKD